MELNHYRVMMIGCSAVLLFFQVCLFTVLSKRFLAELVEKLFEINRIDHRTLMMNFFGLHIDLKSSRRFRLSLIVQLAVTTWIIMLLFMDGCGMQVHFLSMKDECPLQSSDCFTIGKSSSNERITCQPGQILSNTTTSNVICFVWVYAEQNTLNILNQIGICSSVFSLVCHLFKLFCRMSHKWWGLTLLILLLFILQTVIIVCLFIDISISMTAKLLFLALSCLVTNAIQLLQFTHQYKSYRCVTLTK